MIEWWQALLIVLAGAAMVWVSRDAAEVDYEYGEWYRANRPRTGWKRWFYWGEWVVSPKTGTRIRRGMGAFVMLLGVCSLISPSLFGAIG